MSKKEIIDKYVNKFVSRKLLAFIIATIALFIGNLISGDWVIIATVYIGSQAATDIVRDIYKSRNNEINREF
jgi:uncharacterized membrane protein YjjP (DUF1212 family)